MRLCFTVPGAPRGKGRPRASRRGGYIRLYTDAKTAAYEAEIGLYAKLAMKGEAPFAVPLAIAVSVFVEPIKSASKRDRASMLSGETLPAKKPDLDNIIKAVLDGCNGVAFVDDALVVQIAASKLYAETPGVRVEIRKIERTKNDDIEF